MAHGMEYLFAQVIIIQCHTWKYFVMIIKCLSEVTADIPFSLIIVTILGTVLAYRFYHVLFVYVGSCDNPGNSTSL